jgi:hypothetical protein
MARKRRKRPHGMGSAYEHGPGNWWLKWREGGRVRYSRGYATRDLAEKVLAKIVAELAAGRAGLPRDPKGVPKLGELAADWLARREHTHRAWRDDRNRWNRNLAPFFAQCRPSEVDAAAIRRFVERKLTDGLSSTTVGHCVRLLSTFFADVVEQGFVSVNPVSTLPRSTRRLYRNAADPLTTPFLERPEDIRRVFLALPSPYSVAFAVGAWRACARARCWGSTGGTSTSPGGASTFAGRRRKGSWCPSRTTIAVWFPS